MPDRDNYLFSIIKSALFFQPLPPTALEDWEETTKELDNHKITSLAGAVPLLPEGEPRNTWRIALCGQRQQFNRILSVENRLYDTLSSAGIKFLILKGTAAAVYFPHPHARRQNDVDVLAENGEFDRTVQILEQNGYIKEEDNGRHVSFRHEGIEIELHRRYATLLSSEASEKLDEMLFACMEQAEIYRYGEFRFPMPPPAENGLVLLSHISQHLLEGIGLRQVLDWMMYASEVCDDEFWETVMERPVRELGLYNLAVNITFMCQKYLGLDAEHHTWCAGADEALCDQLMDYVLAQGDLGLKNAGTGSGENFLVYANNPIRVFRALQTIGCKTWKALEKYPWLRPFAWLYQGFRLIKKVFRRQNAVGTIMQETSGSSQRVKMLKKLGVRDYNKNVF